MLRNRCVGAALAVLALILCASLASAKKKPKPPPGPDPADTGVIYFGVRYPENVMYEMNTDGSERTALPAIAYHDVRLDPSRGLHDGERWFLELRPVTGQYPNGFQRMELYAVSETGTAVQLTAAPNLEPNCTTENIYEKQDRAQPVWAGLDDEKVSYLAREWADDGTLVAWGIYVLSVDPDNLSSHVAGVPTRVPVNFPLKGATTDFGGWVDAPYSWSPDGKSLVYCKGSFDVPFAVYRASETTTPPWSETQLTTGYAEGGPRWSPDGAKIAFLCDGIETMNVDGSGRTTVIPLTQGGKGRTMRAGVPAWSPSGTHLCYAVSYWKRGQLTGETDIFRAEADGNNQTNLTGDSDADVGAVGWRDE